MQFIFQHGDAISTLAIVIAFLVWLRNNLRKHAEEKTNLLAEKLDAIDKKITAIASDVKSIDHRLTKLEGRFEERGYWESRLDFRKPKEK